MSCRALGVAGAAAASGALVVGCGNESRSADATTVLTLQVVTAPGLIEFDALIVLRENFSEGAEPGTRTALPGESEGGFQEMAARVGRPVALGNPDGTIEAK